jgi:hypothetical protein
VQHNGDDDQGGEELPRQALHRWSVTPITDTQPATI